MERERKESAKGAEFRHKTPGIPCPPHKSPPLSRSKRTRERGEGERKRFVREEDLAVRSQKMETKRKERLGLDGGSVYKLRLKSDDRNVRCSAEIKSGRETG